MAMAVGERIRFIRKLRGMTQKQLGMAVGFSKATAEVRISQYESGARVPRKKLMADFATALEISPQALAPANADGYAGLLHTLFALEDVFGLTVDSINGNICLMLNLRCDTAYEEIWALLAAWYYRARWMRTGEITREEYDNWRYNLS